jgi:hypothetical protein
MREERAMKYIIGEQEKKKQRNLIYQVWRFVCLSCRFLKLTCACCRLPPVAKRESETDPRAMPH